MLNGNSPMCRVVISPVTRPRGSDARTPRLTAITRSRIPKTFHQTKTRLGKRAALNIEAFPIYHFHKSQRRLMMQGGLSVTRGKMAFVLAEGSGNIWMTKLVGLK